MRFFANGPSIPDELLWERDEGKVVFFCGAGISIQYAGLPDFFGLANKVADYLEADKDSAAYQLIHQRDGNEKKNVVGGYVSADYIFGLLERDFFQKDIEEAVASALKPKKQDSPKKVDYLKGHKILLDLATGEDGKVRLVTTNFDRLFEQCRENLKIWQPPKLPDPSRVDEMDGIIYLHGLATKDYQGAEGDGFILSTSQFGRAYLAEGWATKFIRQLLDNYTIVFIGYSADDPPVQYLLEALHKMKATHKKIYAFQSNDGDDVINLWKYKGVMPICFPRGRYKILWRTLGAWAKRARNPDKWYEQVIKKFAPNPRVLKYSKHGQIPYRKVKPFERGQIAHIVSSSEGAKKFAEAKTVTSAEWLYVFDKFWRYATPYRSHPFSSDADLIDPFSLYGLDSDVLPSPIDPTDDDQERETPSNAWDAFDINGRDRLPVDDATIGSFRANASILVDRQEQLSLWLTKVIDQPTALCWAVGQKSLNSSVINNLSEKLANNCLAINSSIQRRWQLLIENWKNKPVTSCFDWYELDNEYLDWNTTILEKFKELTFPRLDSSYYRNPKPIPENLKIEDIRNYAPIDIDYSSWTGPDIVPDRWCLLATKTFRKNLETTILLEIKLGVYGLIDLDPIIYKNGHIYIGDRTQDISRMVKYFAKLFDQLCKIDPFSAKFEFLSWPRDDDIVFAHLRIWAAGKPEIVADDEFGQFISSLSEQSFWLKQHEDNLLLVLKKRWKNLDHSTRSMIEKRLLESTLHFTGKDQLIRKKRQTWLRLNRLQHLIDEGCELSSATQKKAQKLRSVAPDWTEEQARNSERHITSGFVATNTDCTALLNIPLSDLLPEADRIQQNWDDIRTIYRPFEGLVVDKPVRAFSALCFEAKKGIFREWAWETFFYSKARKEDRNHFKLLIANCLLNYSDEKIAIIIKPISYWLYDNTSKLEKICLPVFFRLIKKIVGVLQTRPVKDRLIIVKNSDEIIHRFTEAKGASSGTIARVLLAKSFKQNVGDKCFHKEWFGLIESLLKLPEGSRQYVLVILFEHINWFFQTDKGWTRKYLLPIFHCRNTKYYNAAWSGFLHFNSLSIDMELFIAIKADLIRFVKIRPHFNSKKIADLILDLWTETDNATGAKRVTDEELHELLLKSGDELRTGILKEAAFRISIRNKNLSDQSKSLLPALFAIWPKQMKAWSPEVSAGFFRLLLLAGEQFSGLLNVVINRLNKIYDLSPADFYSLTLDVSSNNFVKDHAKELLELLFTVLPNDTRQRPFKIDDILQKIVDADSSLKKDARYIELKRRYAI
ncbi:SIR2 family protein [Bartonella apis]|uniref:SIR2 family protein n=1 Tax=Bartonella apis TaxID=1686310 RepID=UPI003997A369